MCLFYVLAVADKCFFSILCLPVIYMASKPPSSHLFERFALKNLAFKLPVYNSIFLSTNCVECL